MSLFTTQEGGESAGEGILLTAVGGCGLALLDQVQGALESPVRTLALDTDSARLADVDADDRLLLGKELTEGYGTGGDERVGRRCLNGRHTEIRSRLGGAHVNLILGGLGGGTATALMPEIAKISRSLGELAIVVVTRPFRYEGHGKVALAKRTMHSLVRSADSVFVLNNEATAGDSSSRLSASEALKRSDAAVSDTVVGILRFLQPRKRKLLDYGTVKSHLTHGGLAAYASGLSAMRNNAIEALKAALDKFARLRNDITKAPRALIQFSIDDDVLLDGVKNAFGVAQRIFNKDAQLAMGVVFNGLKQGKTMVSIIAGGLPLYNEVVETDLVRSRLADAELEQAGRMFDHAGVLDRRQRRQTGAYTVLNPRRPSDEELKIPAYLRRRAISKAE